MINFYNKKANMYVFKAIDNTNKFYTLHPNTLEIVS